jgi:hypothetical protein
VWWQQRGFITDGFNLAAEKRETSLLQSQVIYRLMENNARIRTMGDLSSLTFRIVLVRNPKFHNRNHKIPQLNLIKLLLRIREINYTYLFSYTSLSVTGEWRKLHNEELRDLYSSPSIIRIIKSRRIRWAGDVARMGEKRNAYRLLVGKPEGKRLLGRPRRKWVDNIRMDLGEVG